MTKKISDNGVVRDMTTEEETEGILSTDRLNADKLESLRMVRNALLLSTDYMALSCYLI